MIMPGVSVVGSLLVFLASWCWWLGFVWAGEVDTRHLPPAIGPSSEVCFTSELWPGEGRPRFRAKRSLVVYQSPSLASAPLTGDEITAGELIEFTDTRFHTVRPGVVVVKEATTLAPARAYGPVTYLAKQDYEHSGKRESILLKQGETVLVLQYRAEGEYVVQIHGNVYGVHCALCAEAKPETQWWVQVGKGSRRGWVQINEENVEFLDREF